MSDLEATSSPAQHAAPITSLAHGKLRSLRTGGLVIAGNDGMLDAFAEVFARMAAAAPPAQQAEGKHDQAANEFDAGESSDTDQPTAEAVQSDPSADSQDVKLDPIVTPIDIDPDAVVSAEQQVQVETPEVADESQEEARVQTDGEVVQTIVHGPTTPVETADQESITPATVINVAVSEDTSQRRDARRDTNPNPAAEIEEPEIVQQRDERGPETKPAEIEAPVTNVGSRSDTGQDSHEGSRRRLRRDRRTDSSAPVAGAAPKEQASHGSATNKVELGFSAVDSERPVEGPPPSTPAPPEVRRAAASAITGAPPPTTTNTVQASAPQNSGGTRQAAGNANSAIDSLQPSKTDSKSKSDAPAKNHTTEAVNRAKLIQRVSKAFQHLGPEGGVVRLRLAPAELGTVRVEMRINQRKVSARVVAETEAASGLLRENLHDLRSRLESFGMQIERIDIETDSGETNLDGRFNNPSRGDGWNEQQDNQPFQRSIPRVKRNVSQPVSSPADTASENVATRGKGGMDLRL